MLNRLRVGNSFVFCFLVANLAVLRIHWLWSPSQYLLVAFASPFIDSFRVIGNYRVNPSQSYKKFIFAHNLYPLCYKIIGSCVRVNIMSQMHTGSLEKGREAKTALSFTSSNSLLSRSVNFHRASFHDMHTLSTN